MNELKVGDVVYLNSEKGIELTVSALLAYDKLEAIFWNGLKGEFQTIVGGRNAFTKVND